jgi:hypothetical protein
MCRKKRRQETMFYYVVPTTMATQIGAGQGAMRQLMPPFGMPGFPGGGTGGPGGGTGFPGGGPGGPSGPGGGGQPIGGGQSAPPSGPPPAFTPTKTQATKFTGATAGGAGGAAYVSPQSVFPCLNRYTFVWLDNGGSFWFWPTYIDFTTVAGYQWTGVSWAYLGIDPRRIDYFYCT